MRFPQVNGDSVVGIPVRSPQFLRGKSDLIEPLRVFALAVAGAVGKDVESQNLCDGAGFATSVTGQAGMAFRMQVDGLHNIPNSKYIFVSLNL